LISPCPPRLHGSSWHGHDPTFETRASLARNGDLSGRRGNLNIDLEEQTVDFGHARLAIELGTEQLDAGFVISRWQRATQAERQYPRALAEDRDEASSTAR
jgi:hypothetical protein